MLVKIFIFVFVDKKIFKHHVQSLKQDTTSYAILNSLKQENEDIKKISNDNVTDFYYTFFVSTVQILSFDL